jgi:hypothetical protein
LRFRAENEELRKKVEEISSVERGDLTAKHAKCAKKKGEIIGHEKPQRTQKGKRTFARSPCKNRQYADEGIVFQRIPKNC